MKRTILFFLAALQAINIFSQTEEYAVLIGWSFANGVLSIFSPTGEPAGMPDYETSEYADLTGKWAADWFHEGLRHQIEEIIIHEGVVNVGANAFYQISNLKKISLPSTCRSIGDRNFNSNKLTKVNIPDGVTYIGYDCFGNCADLEEVHLPNSLTYVGKYAFQQCYRKLECLEIPPHVAYIGDYAFSDLTALRRLSVLMPVPPVINETVFHISTLYNCTLVVPNASKDLYENAVRWGDFPVQDLFTKQGDTLFFYNAPCRSYRFDLREIAGETNIRAIGAEAFLNNPDIVSASLYKEVTYIGERAFKGCDNLLSFDYYDDAVETLRAVFPRSATNDGLKIGESAFENCVSLNSVVLPDNLASIGAYAFKACNAMETFMLHGGNPIAVNENVFEGLDKSSITLLVPEGSGTLYAQAPVWKDFNIRETNFTAINAPAVERSKAFIAGNSLNMDSDVSEKITVYSVSGVLLLRTEKPAGKHVIPLGNIPAGILIVKGSSGWVKKLALINN